MNESYSFLSSRKEKRRKKKKEKKRPTARRKKNYEIWVDVMLEMRCEKDWSAIALCLFKMGSMRVNR